MTNAIQVSLEIDRKKKKVLAVYFRISDKPVHKTREVSPECYVDLDEHGGVVGAEMLSPGTLQLKLFKKAAKELNNPDLQDIATDSRIKKLLAAAV